MLPWLLLVVLLGSSFASNAQTSAAFEAGKSFANDQLENAAKQVTSPNAAQQVPLHTPLPPESGLRATGRLAAPAASKIDSCKNHVPGENSALNQECAAVNFLVGNPARRARAAYPITADDPAVAKARAVSQGSSQSDNNLTESACQVKSVTQPGTKEIRVCNEYQAIEEYSCQKILTVRAPQQQACTPGTWYGSQRIITNGNNETRRYAGIEVESYCSQSSDVKLRVRAICTESPCSGYAELSLNPDNGSPSPLRLDGFEGRSWYYTDYFNSVTYEGGSCTTTNCNFTFSTAQVTEEGTTLRARSTLNFERLHGASADGCDAGGIVPGSWAGDMATRFAPTGDGNYVLAFGTIGDNYWPGWGDVYDRTLTFQITNLALITRFALTRAAFDDWIMVQVNGKTVYVGPYGGDRLESVEQTSCSSSDSGDYCYSYRVVQYCETCFGSPELSTSWNNALNIDLKPYLVSGTNRIFVRTIVAGYGEGAIEMTTRQYCPQNFIETWENQCSIFEQRSRQ